MGILNKYAILKLYIINLKPLTCISCCFTKCVPQCNKILSIHIYYPLLLKWILLTLIQVLLLKTPMFTTNNLGLLNSLYDRLQSPPSLTQQLPPTTVLTIPSVHLTNRSTFPRAEAEGNTGCSLMYVCILQREALLKRLVGERVNEESGRKVSAKYSGE